MQVMIQWLAYRFNVWLEVASLVLIDYGRAWSLSSLLGPAYAMIALNI